MGLGLLVEMVIKYGKEGRECMKSGRGRGGKRRVWYGGEGGEIVMNGEGH